MSTDEMIEAKQPVIVVQPKPKRESSVFGRLRARLAKAKRLGAAAAYATLLFQSGAKPKVAVKSLLTEHGLKVRQARALFHGNKPRKHRARS